jgi:hypothetical protein
MELIPSDFHGIVFFRSAVHGVNAQLISFSGEEEDEDL